MRLALVIRIILFTVCGAADESECGTAGEKDRMRQKRRDAEQVVVKVMGCGTGGGEDGMRQKSKKSEGGRGGKRHGAKGAK